MASLRAVTQVNNRGAIRAVSLQVATQVASQLEGTPAVSLEVAIPAPLPGPALHLVDTPEDNLRYENNVNKINT